MSLGNIATLLIIVVSLTACATPSSSDYSEVDASRVLLFIETPPEQLASAPVEVRRHPATTLASPNVILAIDGKDVAIIKSAEFLRLRLPFGEHRFSVRWEGDSESASSIRLNFVSGSSFLLGISTVRGPTNSWAIFYSRQPAISEM